LLKQNLNTAVDKTECRTQQGSSRQYVIGMYPVLSSDEQHGSTAEEGGLSLVYVENIFTETIAT
jgi:hypothetical protein